MKLPEPRTKTFSTLVGEIENGQIKIPQFQREFVWTMQKSAALIDSIIKGYPIGTFIFWRTNERLRSVKNIGKLDLPEPKPGEFVDYVLDGQQRLTSLFASLQGVILTREDGRADNFSQIFIDLEAEDSDQIVITDIEGKDEKSLISILNLLKGDFMLLASYPNKYYEKLKIYKNRIESYQYSIIQVKDAPIEIATEIFTRINVSGQALSLFEIMAAKTFDYEKKFDLTEKFQELIENIKPLNYETISDTTVLQVVSIILSKECKRQVILKLDKNSFIDVWDKAIDSIERSVEYFRNFYRIPVSQLLPYNALIIPFSYFFFHHKDRPTDNKQKYLEDFFWRCSLSGRYSSSVESKLAQDIKRIDEILAGDLPSYDWSIDTSAEFIKDNGWFSTSRSYIKAILCIYVYHQPKSFNDNAIVNVSNYWLKQANSKNYHHFFPKAHLKKQDYLDWYINHILNITIVDDFLNKREIKTNAPSKYMAKFQAINHDLETTMKTHLIENLDTFGIWNDDYEQFLSERAKVVSREISKRIIKQEIDKKGQSNLVDDFEEELTTIE
ncbi:GmrSD restriction endonuclease domain-containing protein [Nostoc sp.]|uniref:GmrSD restriction endonuclease domain-containing protein n=1 Tax=Nostoc sp. TaxID=1180 RepID=UPI002FFC05AF